MSSQDRDESFGLTAEVIEERRRLLEQRLNGREAETNQSSNQPIFGSNGSAGGLGLNSLGSPRTGFFRTRQPPNDADPQRLRPVQLDPSVPPARGVANVNESPRARGNLDQEGIRIVPQPLPGFTDRNAAPPASAPTASTQNVGKPSEEEQGPFFPTTIMDTNNQRYFLLGWLFLVQAFKISELLSSQPSALSNGWGSALERLKRLVFWSLGDASFFWLVRLLRLPKLTFANCPYLMLGFFALFLANVLTLYRHLLSGFIIGLLLPMGSHPPNYSNSMPLSKPQATVTIKPEPTSRSGELEIGLGSEKELSREDLLLGSSHLLGVYTVKILPDSISKMNPDGLSFCLNQKSDNSYDGPVHIPVYINGTNPFQLRYTLTTLKGVRLAPRDIVLARFARNHLVDKDTKLVSGMYMLQADQPGRYVLDGVYADKDYMFRQSPDFRDVVVAPCPRADFVEPPSTKPIPFCLGREPIGLNIEAKGIPPFLVTYTRQVNSSDNVIRVPGGKPWAQDSVMTLDEISQQIAVDTDIQKPGLYKFRVDGIEDRFNNRAQYNESALTTRAIHAHVLPTLRTSCDAAKHYSLSPKSPKAYIDVEFTGVAPFSAMLGICTQAESSFKESCYTEHLIQTFSSSKGRFEIDTPGNFRVLALSDDNCPATVSTGPSCVVSKIPPPTLSVKYEPIVGTCQYEIGLEATLLMTGQAPFVVYYREHVVLDSGKSRTTERKVLSQNLHHHLKLTPDESGAYTYEFHTLESDNYGKVEVSHFLEQIVHANPTARFTSLTKTPARTCTGLSIPSSMAAIHLSGMGPWSLNYTVFHDDKIQEKSLVDITSSDMLLPLDTMHSPGRHVVQLVRVSDSANCHNTLDTPPLVIDVRSSRPSAEFQCGKNGTMHALRNQEVILPLTLTGEAPWKLNVLYPSTRKSSVSLERSSDGIAAKEEGLYELVSIGDSYCPGSVLKEKTCHVSWYREPTLAFPPQDNLEQIPNKPRYIQAGVCQGVSASIALELTGKSPWDLAYTLSHPAISDFPIEQGAEQPNATGRLALDTFYSGLHTYTFHTIGDSHYSRHQPATPLILEHEVFPRPAAWFLTRSPLHRCANQELENIELSLEGQAPFDVILEWRTAGAVPQQELIPNIQHSPFQFSLAGRPPGSHSLRVVQVSDANGCLGGPDLSIDNERPSLLRVEVVAPPSLRPASLAARRADACVGDRLAYTLGGVSPWEVHYSVNGTFRKAGPQKDPSFRRLIDAPGTFQISQVCHLPGSGGGCCAPPPPGLGEVMIHPLPGALVEGGSEKFVHIHDGEHTKVNVDLIGTPPFQFTYTRRSIHTRELLETLIVQSVQTNTHQLDVSLEGIFEIVSVRDNFCQYPVPPNLVDLDESN